ncbi:Alpha/Beta hydrolase protein [Cladorrhinum samala]|uniref:Alpha/Beta hydrolase protein n=1 Tax=Cladorrhinum samala TaxID=585594 RepID=A0AAV9HYQ4_9PEZI|nr:Alpha/Beta hydrolase protein [Cladorrhinum samala]
MRALTFAWASALIFPQATVAYSDCSTTTTIAPQATPTILTGPFPSDLHGSNYTYPWPVNVFRFESQGSTHEMAFMDLPPSQSAQPESPSQKQKVAILLHGKNFCSVTWSRTASLLSSSGYRVILPDQLGFCKSSKPSSYQFSLPQLSLNTKNLLTTIFNTSTTNTSTSSAGNGGLADAIDLTVIGHSLGGMLAARFSLLYPDLVSRLVLVNPIGLEDWVSLGVPYPSVEDSYLAEKASSYASIKGYQQQTYYAGSWRESYGEWVQMLVDIYAGSQAEAFAWCQARVVDMVMTQTVVYEFARLKVKTLLAIGQKDTTAIGKPSAPPEVQKQLGHYDVLGKQVAGMIPNSTLVEFANLGHAPQIQDEENFHKALLGWLGE